VSHYSQAPIKEAILSLEAPELPADLLPKFEAVGDEVKVDYPVKNLFQATRVEIPAEESQQAVVKKAERPILYQFNSADGRRMFRAGVNGFSFHQMAPYQNWDQFRTEARRLWSVYYGQTLAMPSEIGVRFVNRLPIPLGEDLGRYLLTELRLGPKLPQTLDRFFLRATIPYREGLHLTLGQAFLPEESQDGLANVILDLDLRYRFSQIESVDDLWSKIEEARQDKNDVFEACISDQMRERLR
jgi:uncharacterized protein (TIGR04255 family)